MTKVVTAGAMCVLLLFVGAGQVMAAGEVIATGNVYRAEGKLSRYDYNPWYGTIKWRQGPGIPEHLDLPSDEVIAKYGGTIVVEDCSTIGWHGWLTVSGNGKTTKKSVIVIDCAGADAVLDSGETWMTEYGFAGEMGYPLYKAHPEWYNNSQYHAELVVWPSGH